MLLLLSALAPAHAVEIHDSLATSSSASIVYGGTFTGAGWRVDDANSRMYWDFGTQVDTGDISVTIDDIEWSNLTGANNHLIELFDAGGHFSGATRAINLRVYGEGDPSAPASDWGEVKLKVWDESNAAEARASGLDWDGGPHVWRITWNPTECILYRDGVVLVDLDVTGIDTRVGTLWLPLDDWTGDYSAPIGTLYSSLNLTATEPAVDTGPADDGDPSTFTPTDDVTAASWEGSVYSVDDDLNVEGDGASSTALAWMRFDLSGVTDPVTSATLTVHAQDSSSADGDPGSLYTASADWSEDSLTWATQPSVGGAIGSYGHVNPSDTLTFDVTSAVSAGQAVAFAMGSTGSNGSHFSSKEDGDDTMGPLLQITTGASSGGGSDTGGSSSGNDGGSGSDNAGGAADSGNPDDGSDLDVKAGCATAPAAPLPLPLALALALLLPARRRAPKVC